MRQVSLRNANDRFINIAKDDLLDSVVLEDLADNTTVTTANYKDFLWVGMRSERNMRNHFLVATYGSISYFIDISRAKPNVREFITLSALNDSVENENVSKCLRLENKNVLVLGLFNV
ncbi:hypothetical protein AG1IA_04705 [Rhizoctonia solani AG-1 IA]|uniref:Uncharacterized protein n=1 Tax=Thanatephorus cucumeris (strain AG1-IA) TaxID=983506 RepID=L8WT38_THACA|nr:hypothetical protein AG1IA_04705 [Rhizoctonia solani AG-1 IA]